MDGVPVADQGQHQQQKRDEQQPRRLRRIHRMPVVFVVILGMVVSHAPIVALTVNAVVRFLRALREYLASFAVKSFSFLFRQVNPWQ